MKKITIILIFFMCSTCFAAIKMESARTIQNLEKTIASLQNQTTVPVFFPKQIPSNPQYKAYYAFGKTTNSSGYIIYIDSTKDCHGVKYCNIGSVSAVEGGIPKIYCNIHGKSITVCVRLSKKQRGYYTPGHALADYWPPMLSWRDKKILYTIIWQIKPKIARKTLIAMTN